MRTSKRLWVLSFVGVSFLGANEWVEISARADSSAEPAPISIGGAVALDDAHAPTGRLPSSSHAWNSVADYTFDVSSNEIATADSGKAREVANRLREVPSLRVALDGPNVRRVDAVRDALIGAGVPSFKIQTGEVGYPQIRADDRVAVLVID